MAISTAVETSSYIPTNPPTAMKSTDSLSPRAPHRKACLLSKSLFYVHYWLLRSKKTPTMTAGYMSDIEVHPPRRIPSRDILLARDVASKRCSLPPASLGRMFAGGCCAGLHGMRDRRAKRGRHRLWVSGSRFAVWSYRLGEGRIRMVYALIEGG